jgi:hypothetical protein
LILLRALLGETSVRKWFMRSAGGMDGAQATSAMWGRMQWKRLRILEFVLVEMSNNAPMVWWTRKLGRSLWIRNPWRAFLRAEAMVMTKSGAARVRGHRIPRPPARRPN